MAVKKRAKRITRTIKKATARVAKSEMAKDIARREKLVLAKTLEDLAKKLKKQAQKK